MNIFKETTFTWKQIGMLKFAVLFIGIAIGSAWSAFFDPYIAYLVVAGLVLSLYVGYVWSRNK